MSIQKKSRVMNRAFVSVVFALAFSMPVYAGIIVDKSFDPTNNISATSIDDSEGRASIFDDFSLNSDTKITDITFWGSYWADGLISEAVPGAIPENDELRVTIEKRSGTSRTGLVYDGIFDFTRTDTGLDKVCCSGRYGTDIWKFSGSGLDIDLAAGDYWLSFYLASYAPDLNLVWQRSAESAPIGILTSYSYQEQSGDKAFVLESNNIASVPEPSSIALLGAGLLGVTMFRRKKTAQ